MIRHWLRMALWGGLLLVIPAAETGAQTPACPPPTATTAGAPLSGEREASLRARVTRWYELRKVRDQRGMYDLLDPEYRAATDYATYVTNTAVRLRFALVAFEVTSVQPGTKPECAVARVTLTMDLGRFGNSPVVSDDPWVWRNGEWWAVFKPFEPPFRKPEGPIPGRG